MTSENKTTDMCHASDILRKQLNELHDTYGLSWRKIAKLEQYKRIPPGTLCAFANGSKRLPDKFKARFSIPFKKSVEVCLVHNAVHRYDCSTQTIQQKPDRNPRVYKSLYDWPVHLLRSAIENREVME